MQVSLKDPGLAGKLEQLKMVEDFLREAGNAIGSVAVGINEYAEPAKFGSLIESHLRSVLKDLMEEERQLDSELSAGEGLPSSPFPGLRPFSEEEWLIFFGREGETSELIQRLGSPKHRFVAVIGSSGVGKSSLVNAGMIPALRSAAIPGADSWQICGCRRGRWKAILSSRWPPGWLAYPQRPRWAAARYRPKART